MPIMLHTIESIAIGLDCFRLEFYFISALNVFGDPRINILSIICIVGSLQLLSNQTGRI